MLKDVVSRQKQEKEPMLLQKYIGRTKDSVGQQWLDPSLIKVVLGPRRAGKSIFSLMLLKNRPFMYFNFDDDELTNPSRISTDELMRELHVAYGDVKHILFDEIQNLPRWELFLNRLHRVGYNLVVTGSNAHLLSKELATHLTGRHIPIEILPFDFHEFLRAKQYVIDPEYGSLPKNQGELLQLVEDYMVRGGFPEVVINQLNPKDYLKILFDSLLFKDVVKRYKVKFATEISNLASHFINQFSSLYSIEKVQRVLNLKSAVTTDKYTTYLEEAYLIFSLLRYSPKSVVRIKSPKKVYVVDNGFISAKAIQHSPDKGRLMENLVFTELVKHGHEPNRDIFYYKTRNDREVDFVLKQDLNVTDLIQVCYDMSNPEVERREIKALVEAGAELKVKKLTIITWNEKRQVEKNGMTVQIKPLWEWLIA
ncbi:MAG: ATP-binding protein [Patescibacteria group bacterium]